VADLVRAQSMAEALILDDEAVNALARPTERRVIAERADAILASCSPKACAPSGTSAGAGQSLPECPAAWQRRFHELAYWRFERLS
jgi:hypothetical protein